MRSLFSNIYNKVLYHCNMNITKYNVIFGVEFLCLYFLDYIWLVCFILCL
jgi:hypothetical protein